MHKLFASVGIIVLAIIVTGLLLDEAGKGTFGAVIKGIAQKTTKGYGVAAA